MKKVTFIVMLLMSFLSCSTDDGADPNDGGSFYFQYLPIESVSMPQEFMFSESYVIEYTYYRPSSCHTFNDLFFDADNNTRTIAVINTVSVDNGQCVDLQDELVTGRFTFIVSDTETYLFRYWQGEDSNGNDIYLELEIPVVQ